MAIEVPTADEFNALAARVAKLEAAVLPPPAPPPTPPAPQPAPSTVKIMPAQIAAARAKAAAGDAAWTALCSWLDANLLSILPGTYQGSELQFGSTYAVGFQCALEIKDAARADQYGRKAAAQLQSALRDYQKGDPTPQAIAVSDGTQKSFTLPDDPVPSSFMALDSADGSIGHIQTSQRVAATLNGRTLTLVNPIPAGHVLCVRYVRADYTQTGSGGGGLESIKVDSTYTSRYLRHAAHILDWCGGHPQVEALRSEATTLFGQWADYLKTNGYTLNILSSNYAVGHYVFRLAAALATGDATRLADVLAWRASVLPQLTGPSPSLVGGFWAEGWGYGAMSVAELIDCGLMLAQSGAADGAAEAAFAAQVRSHLVEARPSAGSIISAGDYYSYPPPLPSADLLSRLGLPCVRVAQDWDGLFWPSVSGAWPAAMGRNVCSGTGLTIGAAAGVWSYMLAGNLLGCNHQQYGTGHVELWRNGDQLLVNKVAIDMSESIFVQSQNSNTLVADDGGTGLQVYRFNQGFWYGTPGVTSLVNEDSATFSHFSADCKASYSKGYGDGGPLSLWVRHWLMLKATGTVIVVDHWALKTAACSAEVRWNVAPGPSPTISGTTFTADRGGSRVQGQVLSADAVLMTQEVNGTVPRIRATTGGLSGTMMSVLKSGPSGATLVPASLNPDGSVSVDGKTIIFDSGGAVTVR